VRDFKHSHTRVDVLACEGLRPQGVCLYRVQNHSIFANPDWVSLPKV
jgi:hypothetical protein